MTFLHLFLEAVKAPSSSYAKPPPMPPPLNTTRLPLQTRPHIILKPRMTLRQIPPLLRPPIPKNLHPPNRPPNLQYRASHILLLLHQLQHNIRDLLRGDPTGLLAHQLHLLRILRPQRRENHRGRDGRDADRRKTGIWRRGFEGGERAHEAVEGVFGGDVDGVGRVGDLAGDAADVGDGAGFVMGEEVRDGELGDADGVCEVYIQDGVAGC